MILQPAAAVRQARKIPPPDSLAADRARLAAHVTLYYHAGDWWRRVCTDVAHGRIPDDCFDELLDAVEARQGGRA